MKFLISIAAFLATVSATHLSPYNYVNSIQHPYAYATHAYAAPHAYATPYAYAAPITAQIATKTQYHAQDVLGQASYGHAEPLQSHNAVQDAAGNKVGSYSYVAPNGQVFSTSYVADALGYRVATNALPIGPSVLPIAPIDTPEVQAARIAHLNEHALVASRSLTV